MTTLSTTVLTKGELKKLLATEFEMKQADAQEIFDKVINVLADVLIGQQKGVKLGEIGTLKIDVVPEREHGIPNSDEKVLKPKHYALKLRVSKPFKEELAGVTVQEG